MRRVLSTTLAATSAAALILASAPIALADDTTSDVPSVGAVVTAFDENTPTQLHVVDTGNRTVWLDFNPPVDDAGNPVSGLSKYVVKTVVYANPAGIAPVSVGVASIDFANSMAKVSGLTNGVEYSFSVAAVVNGKTSAYSAPEVAAPDPAGVPADFHITDQGYARVNFDWLSVDEATGYRIKTVVANAHGIANPAAGTASIDTGNSLGYVTNLTTGVEYSFTVVAIVDGQEGPASDKLNATMLAVPGVPGTPVATTVTTSSVALKWAAASVASQVPAISSYRIEAIPTVVGNTIVVNTGSNALTGTVPGLTKGMSYRFRVAAVNSEGRGLFSPTRTYTATNKPNQVRNLTATRSPDGTIIDLDWLAPSNNGGQDPLRYRVTQAPVAGAITIDVKNTSARSTGLDANTTYKYTVAAVNDSGASTAVSSITVLAGSPQIAEQPVVNPDGSATLTFTPLADDSLDYQARARQELRAANLLQTTNTIAMDDVSCDDTTCTATWDHFAGAINGRAWTFEVRAVGVDGANIVSNWDSVTPDAPQSAEFLTTAQAIDGQWRIVYTDSWATRAQQGVYKMTVNGLDTVGGTSADLGHSPGLVSVSLTGLGGQSVYYYDLSGEAKGPFNDVSGGQVSEYTDASGDIWRVHVFTGNDTLTVNKSVAPFRVLTVAGGGGGAGRAGNNAQGAAGGSGGAGGVHEWFSAELPVGTLGVSVGVGGPGCDGNGQGCQGANGSDSSVGAYITHGGGGGGIVAGGRPGGSGGGGGSLVGNWGGPWGGGSGMPGEGTAGTTGGPQGSGGAGGTMYYTSTITGTAMTVAPGAYGSGGGGCDYNCAGGNGTNGVVIISYQIG